MVNPGDHTGGTFTVNSTYRPGSNNCYQRWDFYLKETTNTTSHYYPVY